MGKQTVLLQVINVLDSDFGPDILVRVVGEDYLTEVFDLGDRFFDVDNSVFDLHRFGLNWWFGIGDFRVLFDFHNSNRLLLTSNLLLLLLLFTLFLKLLLLLRSLIIP